MFTIALHSINSKLWEITGDFSDDFIAGFLYGGLYGIFAAQPRLKMDIDFGRYQYYFKITNNDNNRIFSAAEREALIHLFPRTFSNILHDTDDINLRLFDMYGRRDVYRFWLHDMIVPDKAIHVATADAVHFLQGLFTCLAAWNVPITDVLLTKLYYNGQLFRVQ